MPGMAHLKALMASPSCRSSLVLAGIETAIETEQLVRITTLTTTAEAVAVAVGAMMQQLRAVYNRQHCIERRSSGTRRCIYRGQIVQSFSQSTLPLLCTGETFQLVQFGLASGN